MKPNQEYYLDPRWQKFRLKRLEQAHWKCESCSASTATLHVHHTRYISGRKPWEYPTKSTLVVCDNCHKSIHGLDLEVNDKLREFLASLPPNHPNAHYEDMPSDPDYDAEFQEWIYFENGERVTVRRPNPNFKAAPEPEPDR